MAVTPLDESQLQEGLAALTGWAHEDGMLVKVYAVPTYLAGVSFAAAIGILAEAHDHHPDLLITYKKVRVAMTTHDANHRVSARDLALAAAIDALRYPKV